MYKILSTKEMREMDRRSIEDFGVSVKMLMENAGLASLDVARQFFGTLGVVLIFCGKGNNGGDGFVMARHLHSQGVKVTLYLLADARQVLGEAGHNMKRYADMGGRLINLSTAGVGLADELCNIKQQLADCDLVVDAMLGTGLKGPLKGAYKDLVELLNSVEGNRLALDIPSGLNSDSGESFGVDFHADATVTFGLPTTGMMFEPAASSVGRLFIVDIGFPEDAVDETEFQAWLTDEKFLQQQIGKPNGADHKGSFGHVLSCGGSSGMGGAISLAAMGCLKVGAGLSTVAVSEELALQFELALPEVMSVATDGYSKTTAEEVAELANSKTVLLVGSGMGQGLSERQFMQQLLPAVKVPMVIDADGLNNIADDLAILQKLEPPVVITPHPGEMARLTRTSAKEVNADRLGVAKRFAAEYGVVTVLKGAGTVIATPDGKAWINRTGNPNLASGGTGDLLAGMIAGFISRGIGVAEAAASAVYLHGLAADIYTERLDAYSLTATELLKYIPKAFRKLFAS